MKITDNGFGLPAHATKFAPAYESTDAMFDASSRYERYGAKALLGGAAAVITGVVLHKIGLPVNGTLKEIGEDVLIVAGVFTGLEGGTAIIHSDALQDGAGHIDWGVAEGKVIIEPDEAPLK